MSFCCFVPGQALIQATSFTQVAENRWSVRLESPTPINEIVAFVTEPLAPGMALGCHVACAPFEQAQWRYIGSISTTDPRCAFACADSVCANSVCPTDAQPHHARCVR